MPEEIRNKVPAIKPKAQRLSFDAVQFVIDEIIPHSITGHFILMAGDKELYTFPRIRVDLHEAAMLNGVSIKTRFKINYG